MQETLFRSLEWEDPLEKASYFITMSNGYPLQYYCLGNPMDRGVWQATVHRVQRVGHN